MWNGKLKAVTFSIDDGCESDKNIIKIMDKYGIKGTFNLNSELINTKETIKNYRGEISKIIQKVRMQDVREIYQNHEIGVHTCSHFNLTELYDEQIISQVENDRKSLENLCNCKIYGMSYPGDGTNYDERIVRLIKENTPIKYARTSVSSYNFDVQKKLLELKPTVCWTDKDLIDIANKFLGLKTNKPKVLFIYGSSVDIIAGRAITYEKFDKFCSMISGKEDIFYGTNSQVLL